MKSAEDAKSQSPYLSALDFWNSPVWNIEFDELDFFLVWTGFFFLKINTNEKKMLQKNQAPGIILQNGLQVNVP